MKQDKSLRELLTICIPTFNRFSYLKETLRQLNCSPLKDCEIFVLDNASTDNTSELAHLFPNVEFITNRFNIGYANILRCAEYGTAQYVWIIGDDDEYDFSYIDDIFNVMKEGNIGLIHVGAHTDTPWTHGGQTITPRYAINSGYNFFKFTSFIGCNIIRRDYIEKHIISGYNNLVAGYPHMPCLLSFFENDCPIYISQNHITKALIGNQSYNNDRLIKWWSDTCKLLKSKNDQKLCFFDQFKGDHLKMLLFFKLQHIKKELSSASLEASVGFFSVRERILASCLFPLYLIKNYRR